MSDNPVQLSVIEGVAPYQFRTIIGSTQRIYLSFPKEVQRDLIGSGLTPEDMRIRMLDEAERQVVGCGQLARAYVIPYYTYNNKPLPFYRVKILNPEADNGARYRQPRKTPNHIYYPPGFLLTLKEWVRRYPEKPYIMITEGEKKAAAAIRHGFPCVALSGVDSWRTKTIMLPKQTQLTASKQGIKATLPDARNASPVETVTLAEGFADLMDLIDQYNLTIAICYDSDNGGTLKSEVTRAATMLGYEFRHLGIPTSRVKLIVLPDPTADPNLNAATSASTSTSAGADEAEKKVGLDDFLLVADGKARLFDMLTEAFNDTTKFPKHPNPKAFISVQLNQPLERKLGMQVASVILTELDAAGQRFHNLYTEEPYYYDRATHRLLAAGLAERGRVLHQSPFGTHLYQKFGLTSADGRFLQWLASQFMGEPPITHVVPKRVRSLITERNDVQNPYGVAIQASDSYYFAVNADPAHAVELNVNGSHGILFEQGHVEPMDYDGCLDAFEAQVGALQGPMDCWWLDTIRTTTLGKKIKPLSADMESNNGQFEDTKEGRGLQIFQDEAGARMQKYAALLCYISPFLQRWRGLQLPVELLIGEPGSGKSSLFSLRLHILCGRPQLRNLPSELKDWNATLANSGGLVVVDNVNFSDQKLRQRISDELCRLTTEPDPTVEMRKLYTTADLVRYPIDATFGFTAIQQPFQNADLFQRSAIFTMCAAGRAPDSNWVTRTLEEYGGREAWMAHQLLFLHKFLHIASLPPAAGGWDDNFVAGHRLAHLEQVLRIAGQVFGWPASDLTDISTSIKEVQRDALIEGDWVYAGLKEFVQTLEEEGATGRFSCTDICIWAEGHEDYKGNPVLVQPRKLAKYLLQHATELGKTLGLIQVGLKGNRMQYCLRSDPYIEEIIARMRSHKIDLSKYD